MSLQLCSGLVGLDWYRAYPLYASLTMFYHLYKASCLSPRSLLFVFSPIFQERMPSLVSSFSPFSPGHASFRHQPPAASITPKWPVVLIQVYIHVFIYIYKHRTKGCLDMGVYLYSTLNSQWGRP